MTATYERIYQKIAHRSKRQKALAERIFNWTICARRPLRFEELKEAVAVDLDDVSWDRRKISAETDGKRFLRVCGNLAVYHERDTTVRLAHHTVERFIVQHKRDCSETEAKLGRICLTYLGFSDFETQIIRVRKQQDILGALSSSQASFFRIPDVLGISNSVYSFIVRLYGRNRKSPLPDINYTEITKRYRRQPLPDSLAQKYHLLDYITTNWIWHAKSFDPEISECWSRFAEFVFHKSLPFDFRPWDPLKGPSNLPHVSIFIWALDNNHLPLLVLLRDLPESRSLRPYLEYKTLSSDRMPLHLTTSSAHPHSCAVDSHIYPDTYDWPVMKVLLEGSAEMREFCLREDPTIISNQYVISRALSNTNTGLLKSLLCAGADIRKPDVDASNALHNASRRGEQDVVQMLLDLGADANSRLFQDERGRTPLYEAMMSDCMTDGGYYQPCMDNECSHLPLDTMQLLLDYGADPNAKQIGGGTILHKAVSLGEAYVLLLLSRGADVDARNDQQQSILDVATETSRSMVDILFEYNVNIEARDVKGQTALLKAAQDESGGVERVEMLVEHGADIHAKDLDGRNVLHYLRSSADAIVLRLLSLGVDVNAEDVSGARPIDSAVVQRDYEYLMLLNFDCAQREKHATID